MADELSKVQECLDQLATQMFACLHWVSQNAIPAQVNGQPFWPPEGVLPNGNETLADGQPADSNNADTQHASAVNGAEAASSATPTDTNAARSDYQATLQELAQDLVIKEQQIETLIKGLPGLEKSEEDQQRRMQELEEEAKELEEQAKVASDSREGLIQQVEETMMKIRRV
ncbi:MAG: hypothetical protein Q9162_002261 [Coniocarpon cinnabarinum]